MSRTILVTEDPSLHLVWYQSTILIKPLPRCLLVHSFWKDWICPAASEKNSLSTESKGVIWREANGLMWTYASLIKHESDFRIAREIGLLPDQMTWSRWCLLRLDVLDALSGDDPDTMTPRYHYGELRLGRLNLVYRVFRFNLLGYHYVYRDYNAFFNAMFGWLLLVFAYATVASGAFQTVMGVDSAPQSLKDVGYWFSVVLLAVIALGVVIQVGLLVVLFLYNLLATLTQPQRARGSLRIRR